MSSKRLRMMHRRLLKMSQENQRANNQNRELIDRIIELEQSEVKLKNDNQALISKIMDMQFDLSRTKHLTRKLDSSLMVMLESIGNASTAAFEMRRNLGGFQNENRPFQLAHHFSPSQGSPSNRARAQAMVNPMVEGYTIRHPKVALQRIRLNPQELYLIKKRNKLSAINGLSPIDEGSMSSSIASPERQHVSNLDVFVDGNESPEETETEESHEELEGPYVRLNDVLNNSSWLVYNKSREEVLSSTPRSESSLRNKISTSRRSEPSSSRNESQASTSGLSTRKKSQTSKSAGSELSIDKPSTSVAISINEVSQSEDDLETSSMEGSMSNLRESPERDFVSRRRGDRSADSSSTSSNMSFLSPVIASEGPMRQSTRKRKPRNIYTPERENTRKMSLPINAPTPMPSERSRRKRNTVNYKEESIRTKKRR